MTSRLASRRDLEFVLYEMLDAGALCARPRFSDHSRATFDAALDLSERIAADFFAPHNRKGDEHEPSLDGERVRLIPEVGAALKAFIDAGLMAAEHDYEYGGMQLPLTVAKACFAYFKAANVATAAYPFLTMAAANLLLAHGTPAQVDAYARPLLAGRFFGTMCLSEPQAGSSLSDIHTRAEPQADGSYRLFGNKTWISGGEHELAENIVHLVLAKIPGGPPGAKGISLFLCPRSLLREDGGMGERNDVALAGLNHKMGYRGTVNTLLNFGEGKFKPGGAPGAVAYLVGGAHRGLPCMFHMMNEARIGVGLGAVMLGYAGYLHALDYARHRPQGRHAASKNPQERQVDIIEHADVKRMLLAQKAYVEGGLALNLYCAHLVDEQKTAPQDPASERAGLLLDLLTPIAKSWPSQWCLEANSLAIQVLGGYGYTRDYPVEQFYRDNRLNAIHEGTHGIQALDLLGRKVARQQGAALKLLGREIEMSCKEAGALRETVLFARQLGEAAARAALTTEKLHAAGNADRTLANASVYLEMLGHIVIAWVWLRQATIAARKLAEGTAEGDFYRGKLQAAAWFFRWELPKTLQWCELLQSLDTTTLDMREAWF
ncbi:MAG TPA: acyl-CoA dehydrogenase [Burkholderiales bacterium]